VVSKLEAWREYHRAVRLENEAREAHWRLRTPGSSLRLHEAHEVTVAATLELARVRADLPPDD
jgi:hypothetical protein